MSALNQHSTRWNLTLAVTFLLAASLSGAPTIIRADDQAMTPDTAQTQPQEINVQPDAQQGSVSRAIFTTRIVDREPADDLTEISNDSQQIFFFTDLRGLAGQIVTHRWEYNGKVMAEVKFKVGAGPRWRVYSSKNLLPEWIGEWSVVVTDESGEPLKVGIFQYTQAAAPTEPTAADTTAAETPAPQAAP